MKKSAVADVLISLGSNVEKERNFSLAIQLLGEDNRITVRGVSSVYETPALDSHGEAANQPPFHNGAVYIQTALAPRALKQELRKIEQRLGRIRTNDKFASRTIDLDIAFYADLVIADDDIEIPDPDVEWLAHLALPLSEIAPDWVHPTAKRSLQQIADALTDSGKTSNIFICGFSKQ